MHNWKIKSWKQLKQTALTICNRSMSVQEAIQAPEVVDTLKKQSETPTELQKQCNGMIASK